MCSFELCFWILLLSNFYNRVRHQAVHLSHPVENNLANRLGSAQNPNTVQTRRHLQFFHPNAAGGSCFFMKTHFAAHGQTKKLIPNQLQRQFASPRRTAGGALFSATTSSPLSTSSSCNNTLL
ncbi:hypothetical protein RvY_12316 [Ramazzottius varieornatus]|uniref:Secreted protein n=1 Tax=Ramazzottius varieornatus TaxID=947166 RepID=A0A1D1VLE5_RAMVA|nr:hypothetical protein RvY_12316 [Ramazzottius varieornatus]